MCYDAILPWTRAPPFPGGPSECSTRRTAAVTHVDASYGRRRRRLASCVVSRATAAAAAAIRPRRARGQRRDTAAAKGAIYRERVNRPRWSRRGATGGRVVILSRAIELMISTVAARNATDVTLRHTERILSDFGHIWVGQIFSL